MLLADVLCRIDQWRRIDANGIFNLRANGREPRFAAGDGKAFFSYGFMLADYPGLIAAYWIIIPTTSRRP